jgi:hypothetical protein
MQPRMAGGGRRSAPVNDGAGCASGRGPGSGPCGRRRRVARASAVASLGLTRAVDGELVAWGRGCAPLPSVGGGPRSPPRWSSATRPVRGRPSQSPVRRRERLAALAIAAPLVAVATTGASRPPDRRSMASRDRRQAQTPYLPGVRSCPWPFGRVGAVAIRRPTRRQRREDPRSDRNRAPADPAAGRRCLKPPSIAP